MSSEFPNDKNLEKYSFLCVVKLVSSVDGSTNRLNWCINTCKKAYRFLTYTVVPATDIFQFESNMTFAIVASKCVHTSSIVGAEALSETHSSMSRMENQDTSDTPRKHPPSSTFLCLHPEHTARTHTCGFFTGNSDYSATNVLSSGKSSGSLRHIHWISITLYSLF